MASLVRHFVFKNFLLFSVNCGKPTSLPFFKRIWCKSWKTKWRHLSAILYFRFVCYFLSFWCEFDVETKN